MGFLLHSQPPRARTGAGVLGNVEPGGSPFAEKPGGCGASLLLALHGLHLLHPHSAASHLVKNRDFISQTLRRWGYQEVYSCIWPLEIHLSRISISGCSDVRLIQPTGPVCVFYLYSDNSTLQFAVERNSRFLLRVERDSLLL